MFSSVARLTSLSFLFLLAHAPAAAPLALILQSGLVLSTLNL